MQSKTELYKLTCGLFNRQIMTTPTKVWLVGILISLSVLFFGYEIAERWGLFIGFLIATNINMMVFFFGKSNLLGKLNAKLIEGQDPWGLLPIIKEHSDKLHIEAPRLYVVDWDLPTAMTIGTYLKKGSIGVSTGLMKHLSKNEIRAVLAHQICQINRFDTLAFGVASVIANSLLGFAAIADEFWPFKFKFFVKIFSPFSWFIVRMTVNSKNYLRNDLDAVHLIEDKRDLASALYKLENLALASDQKIPPCTGHLFIVNPDQTQRENLFLHFQPELKSRIKNIIGTYPL